MVNKFSILVTDVLIEKLIQIVTEYNIISRIIFTPSSQMLPRIILIQEDTLICLAYYEISLASIISLTENITRDT